jgi:hypothetical protein
MSKPDTVTVTGATPKVKVKPVVVPAVVTTAAPAVVVKVAVVAVTAVKM